MTVDLTKSRRTLPAPMLDRSTYSIFSVIKQAIGKDLTKFSIPVVWNEPLSFLQRLAECLEYSTLLDQAAQASSSLERFHYITAFVVSTLSAHLERMSKPFNPLLGETYELQMNDQRSFHYISEQVCHHPPISALFIRNPCWTLSANIESKVKFHGTNVHAIAEGRWILRIKNKSSMSRSNSQSSFQSCEDEELNDEQFDDEYTWKTPNVIVHNILFGRLWCEFYGQVDIQHTQSAHRSVLTVKSHSLFASQSTKIADLFKYFGLIYNGKEKLGAFHGNYGHCYYAIDNLNDIQSKSSSQCAAGGHNCIHISSNSLVSTSCDLILTPSSRCIWFRTLSPMTENEISSRSQYYFFTLFTLCLNESIQLGNLPATDSRYRQDIRCLEKGEIQGASDEKHRLEEQQRADAKKREQNYQPLWFEKTSNGEYVYTNKYEQRNFEHCPKLFSPE